MTIDTSPMEFDLTRIEVPVTIGKQKYVLKDADGETSVKYRNAKLSAYKLDGAGNVIGYDKLNDAELILVAGCLYKVVADQNGKEEHHKVSLETVKQFPSKMNEKLFKRAREISEIDQATTIEFLKERRAEIDRQIAELEKDISSAKKDSDSTSVGSD